MRAGIFLDRPIPFSSGTSYAGHATTALLPQVHCWNEASACHVVLPASEVANHFRHDCQHHRSRCPTFLATVLWRDLCAHLKSGCTEFVLCAVPEALAVTAKNDENHLVAFQKRVERRVSELDAKLAQLSLQGDSQNDKLVDLSHNLNHLNEVTREVRAASVKLLDSLDHSVTELKALSNERSECIMASIASVLSSVQYTNMQLCTVTEYAAHKDKALKNGW